MPLPDAGRAGQIVARNAAVKEARGIRIDTQGLRDLRRDLRRLEPEVEKQLKKELRAAVAPVLEAARVLAPHRSGKLARSLRVSVAARGVAIGSRLPYANVIHWGGSTGRGHYPGDAWSGEILIRESLFLSRALEQHEDRVVDAIGDAVETAARNAGWH